MHCRWTGPTAPCSTLELAERIAHGLQVGAERGRELASTAVERSEPLVEAARKRGGELASTAGEKSAPYVDAARKRARKRGAQLADTVRERGTELAETARERGTDYSGRNGADEVPNWPPNSPKPPANAAAELAARGRAEARRWTLSGQSSTGCVANRPITGAHPHK